MKSTVAAKDSKKDSLPSKRDKRIYYALNDPKHGSLKKILNNIKSKGETPSVKNIETEFYGMDAADRNSALLELQRTHGNQYVQKMAGIQAKLKISEPGDIYEQEADRVAEQVMWMPEPETLRLKCLDGKNCHPEIEKKMKKGLVQLKTDQSSGGKISAPDNLISNLGPGQPLDSETKDFMEPLLGYDLGSIRVHTDSKAAESAQTVNARAYTFYKNIVLNDSNSPRSKEGKRLLAHELVHVIQQSQGTRTIQRIKSEAKPPSRLHKLNDRDLENEWSTSHPKGYVMEYDPYHILLWNFDVGDAIPKIEHFKKLDHFVDLFNDIWSINPNLSMIISGHASRTGDHHLNMKLSQMRVDAVADYVITRIFDRTRIKKNWYGDTQSLSSRLLLGKGMAENRSVELKIVGLKRKLQEEKPIPEPEQPIDIDDIVKRARKFSEADKKKSWINTLCKDISLPDKVCKLLERFIKRSVDSLPPGLISVLTLKIVRRTITESMKAHQINERIVCARAFAYTFVSYGVSKEMPKYPPNYLSLEPNVHDAWKEVSAKVWLSLDIDAINDPNWSKIELYIRKNPEKVLNQVYREVGEELDLGAHRDLHQDWPMPK